MKLKEPGVHFGSASFAYVIPVISKPGSRSRKFAKDKNAGATQSPRDNAKNESDIKNQGSIGRLAIQGLKLDSRFRILDSECQ